MEKKRMKCTQCEEVFDSSNKRDVHVRTAHPKKMKCTQCEEVFESFNKRKHHIRTAHPKRTKCTQCEEVFDSSIKRDSHVRTAHKKRTKCTQCDETFESVAKRDNHLTTAHPKRMKCTQCEKVFESLNKRKQHIKTAHPKRTKCTQCEEFFDSSNKRDVHVRTAHPKRMKCTQCKEVFDSSNKRDVHVRTAHPKRMKCKHCEEVFESFNKRKQHIRTAHPKRTKCTQCEEVFDTVVKRDNHIRTAHPKPMTCKHCGKSFENWHKKNIHARTAHKRRNIICKDCKLNIPTENLYRIHKQQVHQSKGARRSTMCTACGVRYRHKSNFRRHVNKVHNGDFAQCAQPIYAGSKAQPTQSDPSLIMLKADEIKQESKSSLTPLPRSKRNRGEPVDVVLYDDLIEVVYENELAGHKKMDKARLMKWKAKQLELGVKLENEERQAAYSWGPSDNERWKLVDDIIKTTKAIMPLVNPVAEIECLPLSRLSMFQAASFMCNEIRNKSPNEAQRCSSFLPGRCGFVEDDGDISILEHLCNVHYRENSPFVCRLCQSGHSSLGYAAFHLQSEHYVGEIQCPTCHDQFDSEAGLARHNRLGHLQPEGPIFVSNVAGRIDQRQYCAEDSYVENGGMYQLYVVQWMDETGQGSGVCVSFTRYPDVRVAAKNLFSNLRSAIESDGWVKGCHARYVLPLGWTFIPENAIALGIYARSVRVICQLKWWVRLYLNAICVFSPQECREMLAPYRELLKNIIAQSVGQLDQGTRNFVLANPLNF